MTASLVGYLHRGGGGGGGGGGSVPVRLRYAAGDPLTQRRPQCGTAVELKLSLFNISNPCWRLKLETCLETLKEVLGGGPLEKPAQPKGTPPSIIMFHPFFPFCRGVF